VVALLGAHDLRTSKMLTRMNADTSAMEAKFAKEMKAYEDDVRKTMKGLGFNIFIFPEGQELSEVYAEGFASKTMPESYAGTLAESKIVTVNHLLPSLTRKLKWPERERTVILIGIRGEVPIAHRDPKKPLIDPVQKGRIVLGHELHRSLDLAEGNATIFMGREFIVGKCHAERGTKDDITIWMHLGECQELLEEEGRINAIKALECNCATIDRLGEIRREIAGILPGTKVIETESKALARAEARNKAKKHSQSAIASKKAEAIKLQADRERLRLEDKQKYTALLTVVILGSMAWIAFLAFANSRDRQAEIGILRAMGISTGSILGALMGRAFLVGLFGAGLTLLFAFLLGDTLRGSLHGFDLRSLRGDIPLVLISVPVLSCAASWLPALQAVNRDPATILRNE
jgi:putative ABC transport system permease protein